MLFGCAAHPVPLQWQPQYHLTGPAFHLNRPVSLKWGDERGKREAEGGRERRDMERWAGRGEGGWGRGMLVGVGGGSSPIKK